MRAWPFACVLLAACAQNVAVAPPVAVVARSCPAAGPDVPDIPRVVPPEVLRASRDAERTSRLATLRALECHTR